MYKDVEHAIDYIEQHLAEELTLLIHISSLPWLQTNPIPAKISDLHFLCWQDWRRFI